LTGIAALAWAGVAFALLPLALVLLNLRGGAQGFRRPSGTPPAGTRVSILIPSRDEEANIGASVAAALASTGVQVEVVVLDDHSADRTAAIVHRLAEADARVRLVAAPALPPGWAGKQFACARLAEAARHEVLMFIDADVVVAPGAAAAAAALLLADPALGLVSGFPRQRTGSAGEHVVVPWIHVLLLGYLPMSAMRQSPKVSFGAGCGQWMVARVEAYRDVGGHGAAPQSRHDGLSLPRAFRTAGWQTDLFDGGRLAECRMYRSFAEVWHGFGKSAGEGMATPRGLPVWALLIGIGHVLPWLMLAAGLALGRADLLLPGGLGVAANLALRAILIGRLGQHPIGALLHPVGAMMVLAIQAEALWRHLRGRPSTWKGRAYVAADSRADGIREPVRQRP